MPGPKAWYGIRRLYVTDFILTKFSKNEVHFFYEVPVGDPHSQDTLRWPDLILIQKDRITVVEAARWMNASELGQLLLYRDLLPKTPGIAKAANREVNLALVYARGDSETRSLAKKHDITCINSPAFVNVLHARPPLALTWSYQSSKDLRGQMKKIYELLTRKYLPNFEQKQSGPSIESLRPLRDGRNYRNH